MSGFYFGDFKEKRDPPPGPSAATTSHDNTGDLSLWKSALHPTGWLEFDPEKDATEAEQDFSDDYGEDEWEQYCLDVVHSTHKAIQEQNESQQNEEKMYVVPHKPADKVADALEPLYHLFQRGYLAEPWTRSSRYAIENTPQWLKTINPGFRLFDYQKSAIGWLMKHESGLLAYEMGLGKTYILISVMRSFLDTKPNGTILLVLPLALVLQWKEDLDRVRPRLSVCLYHNDYTDVPLHKIDLKSFQVVLTTYEVVRAQWVSFREARLGFEAKMDGKLPGKTPERGFYPLLVFDEFDYIIADEVNRISNARSKTTKALCAVKAARRIGATGTPIMNDYDEVQSLMAFFKIKPWDNYETFRRFFVAKPNSRAKAARLKPQRNLLLAMQVKAFTLHLRTSDFFNGHPVVQYKQPLRILRRHALSPDEQQTQALTKPYWDPITIGRRKAGVTGLSMLSEANVLPALMNARRSIVHPLTAKCQYGEQGDDDGEGRSLQTGRIQLSAAAQRARKRLLEATKKDWHSTRISILIDDVQTRLKEEPKHKILIFDTFLSTLDVVQNALADNGIRCHRYDATIDKSTRNDTKNKFQDKNDPVPVMLCTTQCAGVGLNLTIARTVFILTPGWNPAMDNQAECRAVRVGQDGQVVIFTFKAADSIENHVYRMRREKEEKFKDLFNPAVLDQKKVDALGRMDKDEFIRTVAEIYQSTA